MKKLYQMKILKLLNKKYFLIILTFFFLFTSKLYSEDQPIDIWSIDQKKSVDQSADKEIVEDNISTDSIYKLNSMKQHILIIVFLGAFGAAGVWGAVA